MTLVIVILVVVGVVLGSVGLAFNRLVRLRMRTQEAWSQIDVELKRRHDLIPNLVETVKGYAQHERSTVEAVTAARTAAVSAQQTGDPASVTSAEGALERSLVSLVAVAEAYPQLRAVESFRLLQDQLIESEDKLEYCRHFYNLCVRKYNTAIQTFPRNMMATALGYRPASFFEALPADAQLPRIEPR